MKFDELGLSRDLLDAIANAGYTDATPIQEHAIPHLLMGRDLLGIALSGTGKTAGFTLPMIEILNAGRARARMPRSLILEPTRELAAQVAENFNIYGKKHKLSMALLIGGVSFIVPQSSLIFFISSLTTGNATSASIKAQRIFSKPSSTCFSLSEGAFFKELKISSNLLVKFSNIIHLFQQKLH